jgi:hypothetical protein
LTVNVKVADTDYALASDLTTPSADSWVSATSTQAVLEGDLVEVEVIAATGSPTMGIVQVDFES